ncbi:TPA: hypothetical protein ACMFPZ_005605 [Pseudomonas aeruginosa]|uniref:hypothetical protein n=1 Tax=Pseudomonas aeruginosa TaxID=287 RepID=UPI000BB98B6E|nr:hypothetical protein [Pseudomonas aeruginosa]MBV5706647.1 hypothetical protein [Pseudomonas aeruginosa]MBV5936029.1 hypothetical protein [Pseudomonas aeruginosa]PBX69020.1 hypothetical protein CJT74_29205 [Pseudomonas aeruginosa]TWW15328.1 hypothetical protein FSB74_26075 [Pseudomonas aeruginosa]HBN8314981.1 hypothetical protein [Pseudomonas aeruginosa]
MKRILLALALGASTTLAEEPKPFAIQVGEAMGPAAEAYSKTMNRLFNEYMAGASKGPLGDAARANLKAQNQREREANRGIRRTMKECIKPENVIDDDVKECMEGLRIKEW